MSEEKEERLREEIRNGIRELLKSKSFTSICILRFLCQSLNMAKYDFVAFVDYDEISYFKYEALKEFYLDRDR